MMRPAFAALIIVCLAGCNKISGDAIVLGKEHIAAAESPAPNQTPEAEGRREMRPDEISVDGYVMKAELRGTGRDPRAMIDEQWLVRVRTTDDGRIFNARTDRAWFEKLKEGDRVRVRYRVGKYTGTVWTAKIVGK